MFRKLLAIDLGTSRIVIAEKNKIILDEPSLIATLTRDNGASQMGRVVAFGHTVKNMVGKVERELNITSPMRKGVIQSYTATLELLKTAFSSLPKSFFAPNVVISLASSITSVEEKSFLDAINNSGVKNVYMINELIAAALGVGLNISMPTSHLIVNIGGGKTDFGIISLNILQKKTTHDISSENIIKSIIELIKNNYDLMIGETLAERMLIEIGSAIPLQKPLLIEISGKDSALGLPKTIKINSNDLLDAIRPHIVNIGRKLLNFVDSTAPELATEIVDKGIILVGGGANLRGIDKFLLEITNIPVHIPDEPRNATIHGLMKVVERFDDFSRLLKR